MDKKLVKEFTTTTMAIAKIEQQISKSVAQFKEQLSSLREKEADLHTAIKEAMEKSSVTKFENDVLKITYIGPSVRNNVDVARLKEEKPDVYNSYIKQSTVKSSIRIKVKDII